jgi:flavin-dependent dehydrogenase
MRPWSEYVEVHWSSSAQAYVTPVGEEEVCVVILAGTPELASFDRAIREFPELRARISGVRVSSRERGGVTAMRSLRSVYRGNVALVGDASGGVDAITGEGIRLGLHHALALADAIAAGTLDQYQRAHQALAVRPERMGQLMLWLDRNPKIRARAIRALQSEPKLFSQTIAMHVGRASPQQVVSTGAHLGWRFLAA